MSEILLDLVIYNDSRVVVYRVGSGCTLQKYRKGHRHTHVWRDRELAALTEARAWIANRLGTAPRGSVITDLLPAPAAQLLAA